CSPRAPCPTGARSHRVPTCARAAGAHSLRPSVDLQGSSSPASTDSAPFLAACCSRAHGRGRAELANDLLGDLAGRWADVDRQRIFVRSWFLQGIDLTLQQARRHEVAAALRQMFGHSLLAAAKIDQPDFRSVADDDTAIRPLKRGASNDAGLSGGALTVDPGS